jgi:two-component system chemotaxis response regulator CheY
MAYNFKEIKVLIVESSPQMLELFEEVLTSFGFMRKNIFLAGSVREGFMKFCDVKHDLIIVDWIEDPKTGNQLTNEIRTSKLSPNPFVPVLMTAGSGHKNKVMQARDMGVSSYLVKPFSAMGLAQRIEFIIEKPRPFVVHSTFVGPDRRMKQQPLGERPDRRKTPPRQADPPKG